MIIGFFKLLRPLNLFIIALTQCLVHFVLIVPLLNINASESSLYVFQVVILVVSTLLIAAGGYIINDIKDLKVDLINKPDKVIINNTVPRATALKAYIAITITGILLGTFLAYTIDVLAMGAIYFLSAGLLFFYSTSYKKIFLLGTLIISFITALSIALVMLFDQNAFHNSVIMKFVLSYTVFAFLMTLIREFIKDIEDIEGDTRFHAATLPIKTSIQTTKVTVAILIGMIITLLFTVANFQYMIKDYVSLVYIIIAVIIPLFLLMYNTITANLKSDYSRASALTKLIMLTGILYMVVFYIVLYYLD